MPDLQKKRLYKAEAALYPSTDYATLTEVQAYVDSVIASAWWRERAPKLAEVVAIHSSRSQTATSKNSYHLIVLPGWGYTQRVVLHELAHQLTDYRHGTGHGHDGHYAYWFWAVVGEFMGPEMAAKLLGSYERRNVRVNWNAAGENVHATKRMPAVKSQQDGLPGQVDQSRNRVSGALVATIDTDAAPKYYRLLAADGKLIGSGRWLSYCTAHGNGKYARTRRKTETRDPLWCEGCRPALIADAVTKSAARSAE